jgi:hypothetical protein
MPPISGINFFLKTLDFSAPVHILTGGDRGGWLDAFFKRLYYISQTIKYIEVIGFMGRSTDSDFELRALL